jgi:membrane protein implicated in regulation of membrane protease activity
MLAALIAADVPRWIWAALLMAAVVAVTVLTMWLVRYPLRRMLPPSREEAEPPSRKDAR